MGYNNNMTQAEIDAFKAEIDALDAAYTAAADHDAKVRANTPMPDEWEDPADYVGWFLDDSFKIGDCLAQLIFKVDALFTIGS